MPPLVSSDSAVSDAMRRNRTSDAATGVAVAGHERRRVVRRVDPERPAQRAAALRVRAR